MCGIAGVIGQSNSAALVAIMNSAQARRGPDSEGLHSWGDPITLGHRRLSIFDLSALGHQPMLSPDGQVGLVFNGAIFNFGELRSQLQTAGYSFRSQTDTEVILHGYDAWGMERLVEKMRGMFAIALWDHRRQALYLLRDRLGVKPLVYVQTPTGVAFASTIRALAAAGYAGEIDPAAMAEYFEFGYVTDARSIYGQIRKVPPATLLEFHLGQVAERQYWQESAARPSGTISFDEAVEESERLFLEAVKLRLEADVPVGALLSGGVDSSLVCWAIAKLGGNVSAYTVGTPGDPADESPTAIATAQKLGLRHRIIELSADSSDNIDDLTAAYSEPFACASALGMLRVSAAIRSSATVLLTGDGGDDCFLGYSEFKHFHLAQRLAQRLAFGSLWPVAHRDRAAWPVQFRRAAHFLDYAAGGLGAVTRINEGLPRYRDHGWLGPRLRDVEVASRQIPISAAAGRRLMPDYLAYHRTHRFAGEYLTKVDGGAMHHALEARSPFLDQELWNFAQSLPYDLRLRGNVLKAVLREMARRHVGEAVATGQKRGFTIPVGKWLTGRWRTRFHDLLANSLAAQQGWIDAAAVRRSLDALTPQDSAPDALWRIFVLENWLRAQPPAPGGIN